MFFYKLLFLFIIGSSFGYILELFFRRFFSAKKWINPGFLSGPTLPLYGISLVSIYSLTYLLEQINITSVILKSTIIIITLTIIVTLIEFITGIFFQNVMKVKLWDYSNRFGNICGVICPLFSLFWMIIIAIYYLFIHKYFIKLTDIITIDNFNLLFIFGLYYGILICDTIYSFNIVTKLRKFAIDNKLDIKLVKIKASIAETKTTIRSKLSFIVPGKNIKDIYEHIKDLITKENNDKTKKD